MNKIDKELYKIVNDIVALGTDHSNNPPAAQNEAEAIVQIKTVILEALKAEMPKRKKSVENMGNEMGGSFIGDDYNELYRAEDFGYNQAIYDCLEVINKLLGDSNAE